MSVSGATNIPLQKARWHLASHSELKGPRTPGSGAAFLTLVVQEPQYRMRTNQSASQIPMQITHQVAAGAKNSLVGKNICFTSWSLMTITPLLKILS